MPGPGDDNEVGKDNAATIQALGRAYASLANQGSSNGGFPFGVDASALLGVSPAVAVAAVAAATAKQLSQDQGNSQLQYQANNNAVGSLTAQQLSSLAAALGHHQQNNQAVSTISNLLSAAAAGGGGNQGNGSSQLDILAFLQQVSTGQQFSVGNRQQQTAPPANTMNSYSQPPIQQQQQTRRTGTVPMHSQNSLSADAHFASSSKTNAGTPNKLQNLHNWSVEQLEQQMKLLQQMKQPIPQSMDLLLAGARRKEDKKSAKRVANRKSASTSRARKKALVEEMTRTNARLRRQALILSLLPDLVIAISQEGEITFCSAQVERVLKHKIVDLVGANIQDILIPKSHAAMSKLVGELTDPSKPQKEKQKQDGGQQNPNDAAEENKPEGNVSAEVSSGSGGVYSGAAAVVSNQSFPLEVVKVDSKHDASLDENDNSDTSFGVGKGPVISSLGNSTPRSPSASLANGGSDPEEVSMKARKVGDANKDLKMQRPSSSDDSSSGSTETKNIRQANENLERNVRWHNKKLQSMSKSTKAKVDHKDDVLGDSVTPNNALARLSSLQHHPETSKPVAKKQKTSHSEGFVERSSSENDLLAGVEDVSDEKKKDGNNENASDDSGYRESNDSREETSSCASESSNSNGRNKPLAPTCNVCLIRDDLTTLWCEVTSSIRVRDVEDDIPEENTSTSSARMGRATAKQIPGSKALKASPISVDEAPDGPKTHQVKELLLCLRPIRDGEEKVDPSFQFCPRRTTESKDVSPVPSNGPLDGQAPATAGFVSGSSHGDPNSSSEPNSTADLAGGNGTENSISNPKLSLKKRPLQGFGWEKAPDSTARLHPLDKEAATTSDSDKEKTVVESLMLMSNK